MTNLNQNEFYRTTDLNLAVVLSLSFPIKAIDRESPNGKATFVFQRSEQLDLLIEGYWKRELQVEPQGFANQQRQLKARLYEPN